MNKERFMKDFNSEKIFSLEYDKETLRDMVLEKQEEIEKLNKVEELMTLYTTEREVKDYYKNIINELYTKALDTSITSIDLRDYIISSLGSGKIDKRSNN